MDAVGEGGGCRLADQALDLQAGQFTRTAVASRCLSLN
jgi:hypothetical protein